MIDLSITIVAYKDYEEVLNAVKSIEHHTSPDIKKIIYIVDNSEYDNKKSNNFKKLLSKYSDIIYFDTAKNLGFGKGHNFIINQLNSKYHAIINPDILLKEDSFSKIMNFMNNTNCGMCIPRIENENGELQRAYRRELTVWDMFIRMFLSKHFKKRQDYHTLQDQDYKKTFNVPFGQGSFLVIDTKLFKSLNGFDERYFMYIEDADLCKRVNSVSSLMYFPDTTIIHKWKKASHKNKKLFKIHIQSMFKYFKKWGIKWK